MAPTESLAPPPPSGNRFAFSWGGHLPPSGAVECLDTSLEAEPILDPILIPTIWEWAHLLYMHTLEEFAAFTLLH